MAKVVGILGSSGDGKTTSTVINPDGTFEFTKDGYKGMNPSSHYIINLDKKELPFPNNMWSTEKGNYISTDDFSVILKAIDMCAKTPRIKSISFDTLNSYLVFREFNDRKKLTFDAWKDMALDIVELIDLCNTKLRSDQIVYLFGHVEISTKADGTDEKILATTGKKLKKIFPESLLPIVLFTNVETGMDGDNIFQFETKKNKSSAKTPIGMFTEFLIPNSLALVDSTIREYYKMNDSVVKPAAAKI
jgi:hypothetical protein